MRREKGPDPWLFSSVDYGTLELVTLAQCNLWLFEQSAMAEALNSGQDLHTRLAARIAGVTYLEAMARRKAKDPQMVALRQTAKPVNFGLPGLMGPPKLVFTARKDGVYFCELADGWTGPEGRGCAQHPRVVVYKGRTIGPTCTRCLELAQEYKSLWYAEFPEMRLYHKLMIELAREGDHGVPLESFGNGMLRLEGNPNAASNHFFQNLAAQLAKHAGWLLAQESYTNRASVLFNNYRTVVFVHDETFAEVREAMAHECATRQGEVMLQALKEFVPDVKGTAEPALMRRWFKGADRVVGKDGRLKPWWPVDKACTFPTTGAHLEGCKCWTWAPDQALMLADVREWA